MSLLKKTFNEICCRHLTDIKDALDSYLPIKDLRNLVRDYLIDEMGFETEFMLLSCHSRQYRRLVRLVRSSPNKHVHDWIYIAKMYGYIWDAGLDDTFRFGHFTPCNRLACWFHNIPMGKRRNTLEEGKETCICTKSLDSMFLYDPEGIKICSLFPPEIIQPNKYNL